MPYNRVSGVDLIVGLYLQVLAYAIDRDWPIENIRIFILPHLELWVRLKKRLKLSGRRVVKSRMVH